MTLSVRPRHLRHPAVASAAHDAATRLAAARARRPVHGEHRAMRRARLTPGRMAGALLSASAAVMLLQLLQGVLNHAWREQLAFWSMPLKIHVALTGAGSIDAVLAAGHVPGPGIAEMLAASAATLAVWAGTALLPDPLTPLKYLVRILCAVQATAQLFFLIAADRFPYTLAWHLDGVLSSGRAAMLAAAILTPLLEGLLGMAFYVRAAHLLLVLGYFALLIPHELLAHAWLLEHGSILLMPLLYFAFGALLHVMLLVALLSWMLSSATPLG